MPLKEVVEENTFVLKELLHKCASLKKKVVIKQPKQQLWVAEEILAAKRERRRLEKKYLKVGFKRWPCWM